MIVNHVSRYYVYIINICLLLFQFASSSMAIDAHVKLGVEGNGFHRNLVYNASVNADNFAIQNCHIAIYLELPPILHTDMNELAELRRLNTNMVCSIGEIDSELFMEKAGAQNVTVCTSLTNMNVTMKIPLHQRYSYAKKYSYLDLYKGYIKISLPKPKLLLGCKERIKDHRVSKINLCSPCVNLVLKWREIPFTMDGENYVWHVPVGNLSLLLPVTCITLLTTIIGAIALARTVWRYSQRNHIKKD